MSRDQKKDPWLPQRLNAMLQVQAAEERMHAAVTRMLTDYFAAAHDAVLVAPRRAALIADAAQAPLPNPDDVHKADAQLQQAITAEFAPIAEDLFDARFRDVARDSALSAQSYREAFVAKATLRITRISTTTREQIAGLVREGVENGLSHDSIAHGVDAALSMDGPGPRHTMFAIQAQQRAVQADQRIVQLTQVPLGSRDEQWRVQLDDARKARHAARQERERQSAAAQAEAPAGQTRALTIARTETMAVINGGSHAAMLARADILGETVRHMWLSTADERTRETHRAADGQIQDIHAPFTVGGWALQHPGDPDAPADETANCRCTALELREGEDDPRNPSTGRAVAPPAGLAVRPVASSAILAAGPTLSPESVRTPGGAVPRRTQFAPVVPDASAPAGLLPAQRPWNAVIAVEGSPTGDGRQFAAGSLVWRELPMTLLWQPEEGEWGHVGSVPVGRIDAITRDGNLIRAAGVWFDGAPGSDVETAYMLVENGLYPPSVEIDDVTITIAPIELEPVEVPIGDQEFADDPADDIMECSEARIMAVALVHTPAFAECAIANGTDPVAPRLPVDPSAQAAPAPAAPAGPEGNAAPGGTQELASAAADGDAGPSTGDAAGASDDDAEATTLSGANGDVAIGDDVLAIVTVDGTPTPIDGTVSDIDADAGTATVTAEDGTTYSGVSADQLWPDPDTDAPPVSETAAAARPQGPRLISAAPREALAAAGGPVLPPRSWFDDPQLAEPTAFTITDEGRAYGHLATWGVCHTGFADLCVTAPHSSTGYGYFLVGEVLTDTGDRVATGRITLGGGHADPSLGMVPAMAHYDDAGVAAADVAAGEDEWGIWLAGAARPGLSDEQLRAFRAAPLSGDWRRIPVHGEPNMELMGALCVNLPGFPVPRGFAHSMGGVQVSLAAAGALPRTGAVRRPPNRPVDTARELRDLVARSRRAERLAESLGRDTVSRARQLRALVHPEG
jgi:hypothetical protein